MNKVTTVNPSDFSRGVIALAFVLGGLWLSYSDAPTPSSDPFQPSARAAHRLSVKDVSLDEARVLIAAGALVIDVRDRAVSGSAHLPGAMLIPLETLEARMQAMDVAKTQPIIVYCGNGSRLGPEAAHILTQAGYQQVVNLAPGLSGWRDAGLPVQSS